MHVVHIKVKCCEHEEASMAMNHEGMLHYCCVYCGFELHAGGNIKYHVKWTPHHGTEVRGVKVDGR